MMPNAGPNVKVPRVTERLSRGLRGQWWPEVARLQLQQGASRGETPDCPLPLIRCQLPRNGPQDFLPLNQSCAPTSTPGRGPRWKRASPGGPGWQGAVRTAGACRFMPRCLGSGHPQMSKTLDVVLGRSDRPLPHRLLCLSLLRSFTVTLPQVLVMFALFHPFHSLGLLLL